MDYKDYESTPVSINTRISETVRISSIWRTYANSNFNMKAWETFLWDGDKIIGEYGTEQSADHVINLHMWIVENHIA